MYSKRNEYSSIQDTLNLVVPTLVLKYSNVPVNNALNVGTTMPNELNVWNY